MPELLHPYLDSLNSVRCLASRMCDVGWHGEGGAVSDDPLLSSLTTLGKAVEEDPHEP